MFIQIETTPNPSTQKFIPGREVLASGALEFADADAANASPIAARLFAIEGVSSVFLGSDFISVSKAEAKDWAHLKPLILGAIMDHFQSGENILNEGADHSTHAEHDGPDGEIVDQIKSLLDTRVRPAVAQDGGDIVFHGFERGVVFLHMKGACAGCPSSTMTLKMGIENLLRHYIPEVTEVRAVA